jgi:NADPH-dependent ferric siderophore reductase
VSATDKRGPLRFIDRWSLMASVERVEQVTRRMRRVTLTGGALTGLRWAPGQQVRVLFKDPTHLRFWLSPRELWDWSRTYSLWDYDADAGRYELMVLDHGGDGPGARWIRDIGVGAPVIVGPPEGKFLARAVSPYHLFVGEETAAVCFGAMARALSGQRVIGALQGDTPEDHIELPGGGEFVRVERGEANASPSAVLVEAVRALTLPDGIGTAYLAGEAKTIQAVRRHLIDERGWTRSAIVTKPFWTPGKRGLD